MNLCDVWRTISWKSVGHTSLMDLRLAYQEGRRYSWRTTDRPRFSLHSFTSASIPLLLLSRARHRAMPSTRERVRIACPCAHGCLRPRGRLCTSRTSRQVTSSVSYALSASARVSSSGRAKRSLIRFITRRRIHDSSALRRRYLFRRRDTRHTGVPHVARGNNVLLFFYYFYFHLFFFFAKNRANCAFC